MSGVETKDLGIGRLRKQLKQIAASKVLIGVQGDEAKEKHPNADESVGTIARWLHYGTKHQPARPFVDVALSNVQEQAQVVFRRALSDLIDGRARDPIKALAKIGEMGVVATREAMDSSREWAEPIAESTARRKGHSQPLVDTFTVYHAVSYTVREKGTTLARGKTGSAD